MVGNIAADFQTTILRRWDYRFDRISPHDAVELLELRRKPQIASKKRIQREVILYRC